MLKGIFSLLIFGFIAIAIVVLIVLRFVYKGFRSIREAQEDLLNSATGGQRFNRQEYIRYEREKKEKNPFDADYFKSTGNSKASSGNNQQQQSKTTTRKTTTSSGVTIIDSRDSDEKRKIFNHDDGEYVEFTEVSD